MSDTTQHTVCIIGGGMSGLLTGALLAKNGYKVTVLEKNYIIGGGLQSFYRDGVAFNTGIQSFAGYAPNMITLHLCKYLGIDKSLRVLPTDKDAQEIVWLNKEDCYRLPQGKDAYTNYLTQQFPDEKVGIEKMMDMIFHIGESFDYLFNKPIQRHTDNIPYAYMMADEFIRQYVHNERLINLLSYIGWTTGHSLKYMQALEFCMMMTLYIIGSHRFIGGSQQLADILCHIIETYSGCVINNTTITNIEIKDNKVDYILSDDGKKWRGNCFIWTCAPQLLLHIADVPIFRPAMMQRIEEYANTFSCNIVFCKLKSETFKFINSPVYMPYTSEHQQIPQTMVLITSPQSGGNVWAETIEIYIPTAVEDVVRWANTKVQQRGRDYEEYKSSMAQEALDNISVFYPNIKESIDSITTATALTIRDYYGNPNGAAFSQQGLYIPTKTRISNLFMAGQAVQNQGLAGIATTSTFLAEVILGRSLIEEIAKA